MCTFSLQISRGLSNYWTSYKKVSLFLSITPFFDELISHVCILIFFIGGEIPVTKLAALQKVLQSDFFSAVREVYEHIYDTVDVQVGFISFS